MKEKFSDLRRAMVQNQLAARGIRDEKILKAFHQTPREEFVPEAFQLGAYTDQPLLIGWDQTISQPFMVAHMVSLLELRGTEKVLEIGTGSGYQAAILSSLCKNLVTMERIPDLAAMSRERLQKLGYQNVEVRLGDGSLGYPEGAPYDGIIVSAAAEKIPLPLLNQLVQGGKLVIPIGPPHIQRIHIIRRTKGGFDERRSIQCVFVPLIGKMGR